MTAAVLSRLPAHGSPGRRRWADPVLRLVLLVVGAGQLAVTLPAFSAHGAMSAPAHLAHETGAWNLGLAVCFLVIAGRPRLAAGALPFLLPFTAALTWTTIGDLAGGEVHHGRAVAHLLLLSGALLVSVLALRNRAPRTGPARRRLPRPLLPASRGRTMPGPGPAPGYAAATTRAAARSGERAAA